MAKALVVEDELALQNLYSRILQKSGYQITTASDGNDAIERLENDEPPCLIVLDMRMPNCNGYEVLKYLQTCSFVNQIHVIIATASSEFEKYVEMLPSAEFMLKPVLVPHLRKVVDRLPLPT